MIEGESIRNKKADLCRSMRMKFNAVHVVSLTSVTKVISETLRSEVLMSQNVIAVSRGACFQFFSFLPQILNSSSQVRVLPSQSEILT